jgi:L-cysteine:1D-myo-inositol 2-amino-2-deoxy-alpha-D-glucopyranoside ligase
MAVRLALLADHYRRDREWTDELRKTAEGRLARWRAACAAPAGPSGADLLAGVRHALSDDLDTVAALALVDDWADAALSGQGSDQDAPATVRLTADALLGVAL